MMLALSYFCMFVCSRCTRRTQKCGSRCWTSLFKPYASLRWSSIFPLVSQRSKVRRFSQLWRVGALLLLTPA